MKHIVATKGRTHVAPPYELAGMSDHASFRRGIERRAVDRSAWNEVYKDVPDKGDRPTRRLHLDPDLAAHPEVVGYHAVCGGSRAV